MERLVVYGDERLLAALRARAGREARSISAMAARLLEEALAADLGPDDGERPLERPGAQDAAGVGSVAPGASASPLLPLGSRSFTGPDPRPGGK